MLITCLSSTFYTIWKWNHSKVFQQIYSPHKITGAFGCGSRSRFVLLCVEAAVGEDVVTVLCPKIVVKMFAAEVVESVSVKQNIIIMEQCYNESVYFKSLMINHIVHHLMNTQLICMFFHHKNWRDWYFLVQFRELLCYGMYMVCYDISHIKTKIKLILFLFLPILSKSK